MAFFAWYRERKEEFKQLGGKNSMVAAGKAWKELPEEEKHAWKAKALGLEQPEGEVRTERSCEATSYGLSALHEELGPYRGEGPEALMWRNGMEKVGVKQRWGCSIALGGAETEADPREQGVEGACGRAVEGVPGEGGPVEAGRPAARAGRS